MSGFMKMLISLSVSGTLLFLILKLLKPLYREKFSRCWQYYVWLVVALRFLIPFSPEGTLVNRLFTSAEIAVQEYGDGGRTGEQQETEQGMEQNESGTEPAGDTGFQQRSEEAEAEQSASEQAAAGGIVEKEMPGNIPSPGGENQEMPGRAFWNVLFFIWGLAAVVIFLFKMRVYRNFTRSLLAENEEIVEGKARKILDSCESAMHLKTKVRLYLSAEIASPMLLGVWKPALILPAENLTEETLVYVFRHELTHCRRWDSLYKWMIQLVICVHWFNPFVYRLAKEIGQACELACDEAVLSGLDRMEQKRYGDMLIAFAKAGSCCQSSYVSTALSEGGEHLKERLGAIMKFKKETGTAVAASAAALAVLIAGAVMLGSYTGLQGRGQEKTAELAETENVQDSPEENSQAYMGDRMEGNGTEAEEPASDGAHLELVNRKDAYPYTELNFRLIEETGEPRIFPQDPADIPLRVVFEPEEPPAWGYNTGTTEQQNDTVSLYFWNVESGSAKVIIDDLTFTEQLAKEEPEEIVLNQEIAVYGGTAMLDSVLMYPDALTIEVSGLKPEAGDNTAFILAEEGTVYGDGNDLDGYIGYTGAGSFNGIEEERTFTYAFPEGFLEKTALVFRVINLREKDEQGIRLCEDYPLNII